MELENNVFFWQKLDTFVFSSEIRIDRPKGSTHPSYPNLIYPVDYGCFSDTNVKDAEIHVYRGSIKTSIVNAIAVSVDILKRDIDVKVLLGCTEEEELEILRFLNQTDYQKCILVHRGQAIPSWAQSDN